MKFFKRKRKSLLPFVRRAAMLSRQNKRRLILTI